MLTLSMVVSMTACGNSDAGGSKDSAKNNGNGDEPYRQLLMVLNGSLQPDEERIEQKSMRFLNPELNANLDIVGRCGQVQASSYSLCYQGMKN